jgi:tetratricopeptide (TPR) repeat protein
MKTLLTTLSAVAVLSLSACKGPEPFDTARVNGSELLKKQDFAGAAKEYERSLELKPDQDTNVWDRAAFANMKAGNYDRAAELMMKSQDRRPDAAAKLDNLRNIAGMYLQQAKDLDNAEKYFQKAVESDPKDEQSLAWLAEISAQRGGARSMQADPDPVHLKTALARYEVVIALNPNKPDTFINKRIVLMKYLEFMKRQKLSILADAENQKKDKEAYESALEQAQDTEAKIAELEGMLKDTTEKLVAATKAAKAAGPAK